MAEPDQFDREFEELGEDEVRARVDRGQYANYRLKRALAWLALKDQARRAAIQASHLDTATSAKDAAWAAAEAAREANRLAIHANRSATNANRIAIAALVIAAISASVALMALFSGH